MRLSSGHRIGPYEIVALLGAGGMGEVYRARDTKLGRDVAVKVLPPHLSADPDYMARFRREAQVLASLSHPNIAVIHGLEDNAIVMELVEGVTLADRIGKGPLPFEEAAAVARQIVDALEAAHEKGVIHRDLKPANVKITPEGTVKLLDFGLAKSMEPAAAQPALEDSPTRTAAMASIPGMIMGTAGYMSPEQARGGRVDHRTDIWAFGVVLYEMATARSPFKGETVSDTLAAVLRADPEIDAAPEPFRPALRWCLERDLKKRLGWIGNIRSILETKPVEPPTLIPNTTARPAWQKALWAAAFVAAGALLMAALSGPGGGRTNSGGLPVQRPVRLTTDGRSYFPALSPDGKLVAYLSRNEGGRSYDLRVRQVAGGSSTRLAASAVRGRPAFSADSARVYFGSTGTPGSGSEGGIYAISVLGGEAQPVLPGVYRVSASPDGKWLAYLGDGQIHLRPTEGGEERVLEPRLDAVSDASLIWSADSRRIMVYTSSFRDGKWNLSTVSLDGSGVAPLDTALLVQGLQKQKFDNLNIARVEAWLPDGDLLMSLRYGDAVNLWRVQLDNPGAFPQPLTAALHTNMGAQAVGNRMVFSNLQRAEEIWSLPVATNQGKVLGAPIAVTPGSVNAQFPSIHPDGSQLLYVSEKAGQQGMFIRNLLSGQERTLFTGAAPAGHSQWSPDGKQVAFFLRDGQWPAYVISAAGGSPRKIGESGGRIRGWSQDGRFLLVWRLAAQPDTLGVLDTANGAYSTILASGKHQLSEGRLSPDGRWVSFVSGSRTAPSVWIAPFRGNQPIPESEWTQVAARGSLSCWSPDSRSLYFVSDNAFRRQALTDARRPLGPSSEIYRLGAFELAIAVTNTVSASKDRIFFVSYEGQSDIWMTDFPAGLP